MGFIQRLLYPPQGVAEWAGIEWRLPPELGGGMKRNQVALSNRIKWRLAPEYAVLDTPLSYQLEEGENPRDLEKEQILRLMNIIAEELYISRFDPDLGTDRIENKIQKGENIPEVHLRAFRMSKEEIIYNWLRFIHQITKNFFLMQGKPLQEEKLFQYRFPTPLWDIIRIFIRNFSKLPIWINKDLSKTIFGGKQNYQFWQTIFETGKSQQGQVILIHPINLMEMIQEKQD